ncbi:MAG: hypothetical protein ACFFBV_15545, partial [Promethearchaeota archaeon]
MENKKGAVQCINDEILEKMSLQNRCNFLNNNLMSILKPEHFSFLRKAQKFFIKFEKKYNITHNEDLYEWIPEIGKEGLVARGLNFSELDLDYKPHGMTAEFMRILAVDFFDPQLIMGMGASVLAINPIMLHHEDVDV